MRHGIIWMKEMRENRLYRGLYRTTVEVETCDTLQSLYLTGELDVEVGFYYYPTGPASYPEVEVYDISVVHHGMIMLNFDVSLQESISKPLEMEDIQDEILGYIPDYLANWKSQRDESEFFLNHYRV